MTRLTRLQKTQLYNNGRILKAQGVGVKWALIGLLIYVLYKGIV